MSDEVLAHGASTHRFLIRPAILLVLAVGILLRFLYLDADPDYYEWAGYISDEGRWNLHARDLALFGQIHWAAPLHLIMAPLFQALNLAAFELFGVTILAARLVTAACGSMLLVVFWLFLRRAATPEALLLGITLLAVQLDLVFLSRVAVPEMAVMLLELVVFVVLVSGQPSRLRHLLAGFLFLVAVTMKATVLMTLTVFVPLVVLRPRTPGPAAARGKDLVAFVAAIAIPPALVALGVLAYRPHYFSFFWSHFWNVSFFVKLQSVFHSLYFFFEDPLAPLLLTAGLALWVALFGWLAKTDDDRDLTLHRYLVTATTWTGLYAVIMLALEYFPDRYKLHILVPLAIAATAGISRLQRMGITGAEDALAQRRGPAGWLMRAGLAFPAGVFTAPLLATPLELLGVDSTRLRTRLACIVVGASVLLFLHRRRRSWGTFPFLILWPVLGGLGWTILQQAAPHSLAFWPVGRTLDHVAWWAAFLTTTAALAVTVMAALRRSGERGCRCVITAVALCYLILSVIRIAPNYVSPHYTIRETSRQLEGLLAGHPLITTAFGEGLFTENTLRYQAIDIRDYIPGVRGRGSPWPRTLPDALVLVSPVDNPSNILEREYCLIQRYRLFVSAEHRRVNGDYYWSEVRVFIRRPSLGCGDGSGRGR